MINQIQNDKGKKNKNKTIWVQPSIQIRFEETSTSDPTYSVHSPQNTNFKETFTLLTYLSIKT